MNKTILSFVFILFTCETTAQSEHTLQSGREIKIENQDAEIKQGNIIPELILKNKDHDHKSHITFSKFNVDEDGLDINNSINAKHIITEVISDNESWINGNINITHNPASLLIINPNGIIIGNQFKITNTIKNNIVTGRMITEPDDWEDITAEQFESSGGNLIIYGADAHDNFNNTTLISRNIEIRKSKLYSDNLHIDIMLNTDGRYPYSPKISIDSDSEINAGLFSGNLTGVRLSNAGKITGNIDLRTTDSSIDNSGEMTGKSGKITYRGNFYFNGKDNTKYTNSDVFWSVDDHSIFDTGLKTVTIE
ncbi:TPA: filamentous hemagglutinin N-terminal domain-containing protein [Morganella morganii]|uniref:Filamentous hemagglutinin N-terminal domain-containing protein n=1 Tax=Morganella morganii TaxID=582 RepID=A0AAN5MFD7_MORMO|nr:filamentous hemagglutinin N-terminal domain-containing protein [Morganella morganii]